MSRRSLDETRRLLLDVAIRMLHERGISVGVTHVRLGDVVTEAGLTTGAAYRCWPNQEAFHLDLAVAAVRWRDEASITRTVAAIRHLVEREAPLAEVLRAGAEANLHRYPVDVAFLTTIALRASAPFDEAVTEASRRRNADAVEAFAALYAAILSRYRRRIVAPFTLENFTLALVALSEGFALQSMSGEPHPRIDRGAEREGVGSDWTLLGASVEALVDFFTEPLPPSTDLR